MTCRTLRLIAVVAVMASRAHAQVSTSDLPIDRLPALVDSIVGRSMQPEQIPGAEVVVVRRGKVVFAKGYGLANVERRTPVDVDRTLFRIGSISKLVTAMGVMSLVDRGAIRLDDPVTKYVATPSIENRFARVYRDTERWTECAAAYQQILRRQPSNGRSAFFGGQCALRAARLDDAIAMLNVASKLGPWSNYAAFHLGAAYARKGNADSAFVWLREAARLQYPNLNQLDTDSTFAPLRADPRFATLRTPSKPPSPER